VLGAEKLCLIKKVPEDRDTPGLTARLLDEAKVAVRLNHMNLVQVFDAGQVDDELYIAMELIEGRDLRAAWNRTAERRSRIPLDVALFVVREIARASATPTITAGSTWCIATSRAQRSSLLAWRGEDHRLRPGAIDLEERAHRARHRLWTRGLPGAGAGARRAGRCAHRHLRHRHHPLGAADGTAAALGQRRRHQEPGEGAPSAHRSAVDAHARHSAHPGSSGRQGAGADREKRYRTADEFRQALAEELGRIAPGTDASRLGTFLHDLFDDDIKREQDERERLLREELPKLKEQARRDDSAFPPPRARPRRSRASNRVRRPNRRHRTAGQARRKSQERGARSVIRSGRLRGR